MDTRKLMSDVTRRSLAAAVEDYVSKDVDEYAFIAQLRREHNLERVYRFDIGKHTDGYSDLILGVMQQADLAELCRQNLVEYPDNHYRLLRKRLSERYGLDPSWFVLSAGLESMIDHISRVFLQAGDKYLLPIPNFAVFEGFSSRVGGEPVYVPLEPGDQFQWTPRTVARIKELMTAQRPRLLWISNPANPTGQDLPLEWIEKLVVAGAAGGVAVVVDEAYGEYTDTDQGVVSACRLVERFPNLMVLRTFSKIYALPSLRVGYLMCSDRDILKAINLYRPMFPFSWFSLFVAQIAFVDEEHPQQARANTIKRRERLYGQLAELGSFIFIPSRTNTIMLRHRRLKASDLWQRLAQKGILAANLAGINGLQGQEFLRMTIRSEEDNDFFIAACREVAK